MLLRDRNTIIYGAGGSIGAAVARAFAGEGATVHLCGRTREALQALTKELTATGGKAEVAVLDALDEQAVEEHARAVAASPGGVDVSLNLVTRGDVQGIALVDMTWEDFDRPVTTGLRAAFNTARSAARIMAEQGSGVILSLTSGSARGSAPMMGATGPADAATDTELDDVAETAVFLASDRAAAITATTVNVTCGMVPGP